MLDNSCDMDVLLRIRVRALPVPHILSKQKPVNILGIPKMQFNSFESNNIQRYIYLLLWSIYHVLFYLENQRFSHIILRESPSSPAESVWLKGHKM